jgi:hypothetical protein
VNFSDRWIAETSQKLEVEAEVDDGLALDERPRQIFLDRYCAIFALVSPEDYAFSTQWRWKWNWDRTKQKRYAIRCVRQRGRNVTIYLHKEICSRKGAPPSEQHHIGDHLNGESLDCRRDNLDWATKSMNRRNRCR